MGNQYFRSIIDKHKVNYDDKQKNQKRGVADEIVNNITQRGGRFLVEVEDDATCSKSGIDGGESHVHPIILAKNWVVVRKEKVMLKVLHRLREKIVIEDHRALCEKAEDICDIECKVSQNPSTIIQRDGIVEGNETRRTTSQPTVSDELDFYFEQTFNSKRGANQTTMSSIISLREWIERALESADIPRPVNESSASSLGPDSNDWSAVIRRTLAVSSDSYLTSALRVARSLADQCCEADENNGGHQPLLPAPGTDWTARVVVHLSNEHRSIDDYKEDLQPLPFSWQNPSSDPKELQALLKCIIHDESLYTGSDDEEGASTGRVSEVNMAPYNNVARAEFSPSANDKIGFDKGEMQRIYHLGIVFYELFSGGERPQKTDAQTKTVESTDKSGVNEADVDKKLDPHTLFSALDLSGRLSIFDEISDTGYLFESSNNNHQPLDITEENLMPRKKRATPVSCTLSSISIEPLQRKGVPISLCNLIGNMIDSMNGDLSGYETYRAMPVVRSDLQLMLDKPNRFLYDLDCEKLAVTGLQLNDAVFGRDMDFSALQNSYRRSISGHNECGLIVGPSGIGKTVLANQLGSFASAEGALFLKGKFDQLQQMTPFSALASAFNEYCNQMLQEGRYSNLKEVASELTKVVGKEAGHLVKVIPNLSVILGEGAGQDEGHDCANAQARIQYLLCVFVDVISSSSGAPIVLFLDDLQWSDQASLSVIKYLLMFFRSSNPKRRFFFLGSCREEGLLGEHPFGSMLAKIRQFDVHATLVQLTCFDRDTTNSVVSDLLCLPPRLTWTLSDIVYHKSHGNPLFFTQLMISLCKDKLVRLSLSRRRWEWDEEKIQSIKLPDDIAAYARVSNSSKFSFSSVDTEAHYLYIQAAGYKGWMWTVGRTGFGDNDKYPAVQEALDRMVTRSRRNSVH